MTVTTQKNSAVKNFAPTGNLWIDATGLRDVGMGALAFGSDRPPTLEILFNISLNQYWIAQVSDNSLPILSPVS